AMLGDAVKEIAELAAAHGVPVVHEALDFARRKSELEGADARAARMLSSFAYSKALAMLDAACHRAGVEVIEINPRLYLGDRCAESRPAPGHQRPSGGGHGHRAAGPGPAGGPAQYGNTHRSRLLTEGGPEDFSVERLASRLLRFVAGAHGACAVPRRRPCRLRPTREESGEARVVAMVGDPLDAESGACSAFPVRNPERETGAPAAYSRIVRPPGSAGETPARERPALFGPRPRG
ncbi:MAG: hypothetical protein AB1768_18255, partial [Pseudomonadota bacterium]